MNKNSLTLLLADDISLDTHREKRAHAVKVYAGLFAKKIGASIDLVHVEDSSQYPFSSSQLKGHSKNQKAKLQQVAGSLAVQTKAVFVTGNPAQKLISLASKRGAYEMIIVGTHGRTGLKRLILGSIAEEVVRNARIPVMTIGPEAQKHASKFLNHSSIKVLVPTSLTPNSLPAEKYALDLAKRLGAEVVFLHCMFEGLHPVLQTALSVPRPKAALLSLLNETKETCLQQLRLKVQKASKIGVLASYSLDEKTVNSGDAVLKKASLSNASLIVMGTHGHSLISGAFFGRTARDAILGAAVPVITVRSSKT